MPYSGPAMGFFSRISLRGCAPRVRGITKTCVLLLAKAPRTKLAEGSRPVSWGSGPSSSLRHGPGQDRSREPSGCRAEWGLRHLPWLGRWCWLSRVPSSGCLSPRSACTGWSLWWVGLSPGWGEWDAPGLPYP